MTRKVEILRLRVERSTSSFAGSAACARSLGAGHPIQTQLSVERVPDRTEDSQFSWQCSEYGLSSVRSGTHSFESYATRPYKVNFLGNEGRTSEKRGNAQNDAEKPANYFTIDAPTFLES